MRENRALCTGGFSLMEMLVVIVIMGILAAISVPQYVKTVETSKSDDAQAIVKMIGTTNRMYHLDNNAYAGGSITSACNGTPATPCNDNSGCALIYCKYLAAQDWDNKPYQFSAGAGSCTGAGTIVACAQRRAGNSPGTNNATYKNWGYYMDDTGHIQEFGGAPTAQN